MGYSLKYIIPKSEIKSFPIPHSEQSEIRNPKSFRMQHVFLQGVDGGFHRIISPYVYTGLIVLYSAKTHPGSGFKGQGSGFEDQFREFLTLQRTSMPFT
jgi:hypothetical protein